MDIIKYLYIFALSLMKRFTDSIQKQDIQNFISTNKNEKWAIVKKIQEMKEDSIQRIIKWFSQPEIKCINPELIKWAEKEYFKLLQDEDWKNSGGQTINPLFDTNIAKKESENMFKTHEFTPDYIKTFHTISHSNLLEIPKHKLIQRKKELSSNSMHLWIKDKEELASITTMLDLLDTKNISPTKSRSVLFDSQQLTTAPTDMFNIQCFFEQDKQGHKHYFSLYELLNDLETFGVESWYPVVDTSNMGIYTKYFATAQKSIKLALIKNILAKYRDYQEVVMYWLKDYEKEMNNSNYNNKSGILAEKVVEWSFRDLALLQKDVYGVKVTKASVGQDQYNKIDLIIQIKNKKSWINIQKELQLTINNDERVLSHKRQQIRRQQELRQSNLDLLPLELSLLDQKMTLWKNMDRPIWGLNDILSLEDKEFLKTTFERIITEIQTKEEENLV